MEPPWGEGRIKSGHDKRLRDHGRSHARLRDAQLLIVLSAGLAVVWTGFPIGNDFMTECSKILFIFPCEEEDSFTVGLI